MNKMRKLFSKIIIVLAFATLSCNSTKQNSNNQTNQIFSNFETVFLDAYWKQHPSMSIFIGYGKYYDHLVIPDSASFADNISFSKQWIDSLNKIDIEQLSANNQISFKIIKNQLESDIWYQSVFKQQEWDASLYNIASECDYIINQPYAPLNERLKILTRHIEHADEYYSAALKILHKPTKEHIALAIRQNMGGLSVFGKSLTDSINASQLTNTEKKDLQQNIDKTIKAINGYIEALKTITITKKFEYRSFRIGGKLYSEKFNYDLVTDFTPEQVYKKAISDKKLYTEKMYRIADSVWDKYYKNQNKPKDTLQRIQLVLNKIQMQHVQPNRFFDYLTHQVYLLKKFIVEKNLFDFDTINPPIKVRMMPEYARGFSLASADFTPPYQKQGTTFFNVDDLTLYEPQKAESALSEYNDYSSQILAIHEAVPGHCLQGIYNSKKSPDVIRSVFQNGAMIEGWAVYAEEMMVENGWGNHTPEMEMILYKWKLRELANVIIDFDIQCLNKSKEDITSLLIKECFQTEAQAEEKYNRATVSQVQLCSYYSGSFAIKSLREEYKKQRNNKYNLKDFHEKFLSFGSSPVKFIRESMLK
jgi:uncharacterized protein (DUF885 family)